MHGIPRSRSVDDMDIKQKEQDADTPHKVLSNVKNEISQEAISKLTQKHLGMIASRAKNINRKVMKVKSVTPSSNRNIDIRISAESFV